MPTGMKTSAGAAGNSDESLLAKMKGFFSGKGEETKELTPLEQWDADHGEPAAEAPKTLNDYSELFTPKASNDDNKKPAEDPFAAVNRENLASAAKNLDFVGAVDEASFAAALSGDANALRSIINQAGQGAFTEAMSASNTLMQKRIDAALAKQIPELVTARQKEFEINKSVSNNPLLSDPATKPLRDMLTKSITQNNPNFSAAEINDTMTGYIQALATSVNGKAGKEARMPSAERAVIAAGNF